MPLRRHQQKYENIYFQDRHPCRLRRHQQKYENIYFQDSWPVLRTRYNTANGNTPEGVMDWPRSEG